MAVNELRIAVMMVSVLLFLGVVRWAFAPRRRDYLEGVGRCIVDEDEDSTEMSTSERRAP